MYGATGLVAARVLLVEDDFHLRSALQVAMVHHGYVVHLAGDGIEALRQLATNHIDVVVTDMSMPRMSGLELAEKLLAESPGVRILFMSGNLDHPSLSAVQLPESAAVLAKPFTLPELAASVRRVIDQERH